MPTGAAVKRTRGVPRCGARLGWTWSRQHRVVERLDRKSSTRVPRGTTTCSQDSEAEPGSLASGGANDRRLRASPPLSAQAAVAPLKCEHPSSDTAGPTSQHQCHINRATSLSPLRWEPQRSARTAARERIRLNDCLRIETWLLVRERYRNSARLLARSVAVNLPPIPLQPHRPDLRSSPDAWPQDLAERVGQPLPMPLPGARAYPGSEAAARPSRNVR